MAATVQPLDVGLPHPEGPEGGVLFKAPQEFLQTVLVDPVTVQVQLGQVRVDQQSVPQVLTTLQVETVP